MVTHHIRSEILNPGDLIIPTKDIWLQMAVLTELGDVWCSAIVLPVINPSNIGVQTEQLLAKTPVYFLGFGNDGLIAHLFVKGLHAIFIPLGDQHFENIFRRVASFADAVG